jgi:hypothetical protein
MIAVEASCKEDMDELHTSTKRITKTMSVAFG